MQLTFNYYAEKTFEGLSLTAYCHVELVETLTGSGFRTVNGF